MLPVAVIMFAESLMPIAKIEAALQRVPIKVDNPYMALLYAYALTFVPMGVRLMISLATHNNVEPRKSVEQVSVFSRARVSYRSRRAIDTSPRPQLCATNKFAARVHFAHYNLLENLPIFSAGVLSAVQAQVDPSAVTALCTLWLLSRSLYCVFYAFGIHDVIAFLRTFAFLICLAVQAQLFFLAAAKLA